MKHFLAYGNSDQASFRTRDVQSAFDYLTVPGTIAAYYPDATAGFVLSSKLEYVVDPRTPLFQGDIDIPKASHYSLSEWHGPAVRARMGDDLSRDPVSFSPGFYTPAVIRSMVDTIVARQREYGERAAGIQEQLDRYERLLAAAHGVEPGPVIAQGKRPAFIVLPYFVTDGQDEWVATNRQIRDYASDLDDPSSLSAVVAVKNVAILDDFLGDLPNRLSASAYFWVDRFDERAVVLDELVALGVAVRHHSQRLQLINLYGGFFSICLAYVGLWGFNNGLGYSESRDWPDLPATGAAPARYYLPRLHAYVSPGLAEFITREAPALACPCPICENRAPVALTYPQLKQHFALARKREISFVSDSTSDEVADELDDAAHVYLHEIAPILPPGIGRVNPQYLRRWASALRQLAT